MKIIAGDMYSFLKRFHEEYDPLEYTSDTGIDLLSIADALSRRYENFKDKKFSASEARSEIIDKIEEIRTLLRSMKKEELINLINSSTKENLSLTDQGLNYIFELMILEMKHREDRKIS